MAAPTMLGPYRVVEELGRGGMAAVYRGIHVKTSQVVAIKTVWVPKGYRLAGLRSEIHALKRIQHSGVVRILDAGLDEWPPWYAMELLKGQTLKAYLRALWDLSPTPGQSGRVTSVPGTTPTTMSSTVVERVVG